MDFLLLNLIVLNKFQTSTFDAKNALAVMGAYGQTTQLDKKQ